MKVQKILDFITPIFYNIKKAGDTYTLEATTKSKGEFSSEFSLAPGLNKAASIENALSELAAWLPQTRRFFCASRSLMDCVTSEFISSINDVLVKNICKTTWAELLMLFDVDVYLDNIGMNIGQFSEMSPTLVRVQQAYDHIMSGDHDQEMIEDAWKCERMVQDFKDSMTWVEQARGGQTNLNELFSVCGNHMLGKDFDVSAEKESIFKLNHKISLRVNRATAIADIEELSMLSVNKVYIDIEGNRFVASIKGGANIDCTINLANPDACNITTVIPVKRVFIGYGKETLNEAKKLLKNLESESESAVVKLLEEICATYIDLQKPFAKTLIDKNFDDMLNIFGVKTTGNKPKDLKNFDEKVFEDVVNSIKICTKQCSQYLVPMDMKKFEEMYGGFFNGVFGQAFKYFYSVSPDI